MTIKNKKASYLYERTFYPNSGQPRPDAERQEFWSKNLGEEFFLRLYAGIPEAADYLRAKDYDIDRLPKQSHRAENEAGEAPEKEKTEEIEAASKEMERKMCERLDEFVSAHQTEQFLDFYREYLRRGLAYDKRLQQKLADMPGVCGSYLHSLFGKLARICIRILIYELHVSKSKGELPAGDQKEEYRMFCAKAADPGWRKKLEEKYPLLERSVSEIISGCGQLWLDALNRLEADREAIERILCGKPFGSVMNITGDIADSHRGGQSVLKVHLDNGCVILYKPHSIDNEQMFEDFAEYLGKACNLPMFCLKRICGDNYGWEACVERKECKTEEEIRRFYRRTGMYLFIFYLLGTNDIHGENVIAHGEYPVVVDMENILGIQKNTDSSNIMEQMRLYLQTSVLASGMLPSAKWQQEGRNVNISGIGGGGRARLPFRIPVIMGAGTSDIRITYRYPEFEPDENAPMLRGKCISPEQYEQDILAGFAEAWNYVMGYTEAAAEQLEKLQDLKSRYLLADTQRYAMCLNSSYHPSLMTDGGDRQLYLYTICYGRNLKQPGALELIQSEIKDMSMHDIPYFYFQGNSRHLYNSEGKPAKDYFAHTSYEQMRGRLYGLSEADLEHQKRLIHITLTAGKEVRVNRKLTGKPRLTRELSGKEAYPKLAAKVMERLFDEAVYFGDKPVWYVVNMASFGASGWQIEPMHMYLYGGVMGIALLGRLMETYTGSETYARVSCRLEKQLFDYTGQLEKMRPENLRVGIYNGEMSMVYGYLFLHRITGRNSYMEYARRHAELVFPAIERETNCDLLDGLAGVVWGMLMLYERSGRERYLEAARQAGDRLLREAHHTAEGAGWLLKGEERPLLGLSHGNAGIAAALAKLYDATKEEDYYELLREALAYENSYYSKELGNWMDFRVKEKSELERTDTCAWCHGAGGILASRLMMRELVREDLKEIIEKDMERAGRKLREQCLRDGMCLCHGSCGNVLLLAEYEGESRAVKTYDSYICEKLSADGFSFLAQERYNPGLMNGYLGAVYYAIKRNDITVPNLLILD